MDYDRNIKALSAVARYMLKEGISTNSIVTNYGYLEVLPSLSAAKDVIKYMDDDVIEDLEYMCTNFFHKSLQSICVEYD